MSVTLTIDSLPTTQFTAGTIAKQHGVTIGEAHKLLAPLVKAGKVTSTTAKSGAVNYKVVKAAKTSAPKPSGKTTKATGTTTGTESAPKAHDNDGDRLTASKAELKALKAWQAGGEKGERPATPNYDAIQAGYAAKQANGGKAPRKAKAAGTGPARGTTVRFLHDGTPMPDSQNKLSSVAWYYTKGIGGEDVARISVTELRDLLVAGGIADPSHTSGWSFPLPNGVVISAGVLVD